VTTEVTSPATLPSLPDDPFGTEVLTDPYEFHHRLREAGPVVSLPRYGLYAMGRFDEVRASLLDWQTFVSSRGAGLADFAKEKPWRPPSLLLEADPPDHTVVRTAMNGVIAPRTIRTLRERFAQPAEEIAERLVELGTFDAVTDLAEVYPLQVFPDAVGLPEQGRENLLPYGALAFNAFGPDNELRRTALANAAPVQAWILASCQREALAPGGFGAQIWEAADRGEITTSRHRCWCDRCSAPAWTPRSTASPTPCTHSRRTPISGSSSTPSRSWRSSSSTRRCAGNRRCRRSSAPPPGMPR
jgi:4-methoxybenzoate monooxygenase (O-demethylating)